MIRRFERFSFALSEGYYYWHKLATEVMERYGLRGVCAVYFTALYEYEREWADGMTAAQLCEVCGRDKADVSRSLTAMEQQGLILREQNGHHSYRSKLHLTETGRRAAAEIERKIETAVALGGAGLDEQQREIFYRSLEQIVSNLQTLSETGWSI